MKRDELKTYHTKTVPELQAELITNERQLLDLRFDAGLNKLTNPALLTHTRKHIALLKTLIREHELMTEHGFATMQEYKAYKTTERKTHRAARKAR